MKHKRALKLLRKWQRRLHLDDWDIGLTTVAEEVLNTDCGTVVGLCHRGDTGAVAQITIAMGDGKGVEGTVVHELLHLILTPLVREGKRLADLMGHTHGDLACERLADSEETAVDRLTKVLRELTGRRDGK